MSGVTRSAHARWFGVIDTGHGEISCDSGAFTDLTYTFASRTASKSRLTDPEELLAAAHAGCFAMALTSELGQADKPAVEVSVSSEVTLAPTDVGRRITNSTLYVEARFDGGADEDWFSSILARADERCPFSALIRASGTVVVSGTVQP